VRTTARIIRSCRAVTLAAGAVPRPWPSRIPCEPATACSWRAVSTPVALPAGVRVSVWRRGKGLGDLDSGASLEEVADDFGLDIDAVRWAQSYELS
jgi:hypothetical protein